MLATLPTITGPFLPGTVSRSIADSVLKNYDGFLKVDGEVGNKKIYDPRAWGKIAETAMAMRVVEATRQLGSAGHSSLL